MLPIQLRSPAPAVCATPSQNVDLSTHASAPIDPVMSELNALIGGKFVLVFIGFSGQGYQDQTRLDKQLTRIMQQAIEAHGEANVVVVAGATKDGIGRCYEIAKDPFNLQTIGIVSELGMAYTSQQCDKAVYVSDPDKRWQVRTPDNTASYMVSVAEKHGEMHALGGGAIAIEELKEALERGIACKIIDDFMPGRPSDPAHPMPLNTWHQSIAVTASQQP